jgi:hypothetical protein
VAALADFSALVASALVAAFFAVCAWAAGSNISNAKAGSRHRISFTPIRQQILVERMALATAIDAANMMGTPHAALDLAPRRVMDRTAAAADSIAMPNRAEASHAERARA